MGRFRQDLPYFFVTHLFQEGHSIAYELDPKEIVDFRELVMANTIQVDTMYELLIQKGYFYEAEFLEKMTAVQADYQSFKKKLTHIKYT